MPKLAVLGYPISHSLSPLMQNAALREAGLADEWTYEAIEVTPEDFESCLRHMIEDGFRGANVTIPHKVAALEIADSASPVAAEIGAANTLTFTDDGRIVADNTDAPGFLASLPESPRGRRAVVLGAGGSARAVVWALVSAGAETLVWNRTASRAAHLAGELGAFHLDAAAWARLVAEGTYDLLVNTTSVGLRPASSDAGGTPAGGSAEKSHSDDDLADLGLSRANFNSETAYVDLVYGDQATPLAAAAKEAGARVVDGRAILIQQGAISFEIWTGQKAPIDAMREALTKSET